MSIHVVEVTPLGPQSYQNVDTIDDCNRTLESWEFPASQFPRVFAVGDVHGDFQAMYRCLEMMTECIEKREDDGLHWKQGVRGVAIVFIGDVTDRHRPQTYTVDDRVAAVAAGSVRGIGEIDNEEILILDVINTLSMEAEAAGGAVFRIIGNHELMPMLMPGVAPFFKTPHTVNLDATAKTPQDVEAAHTALLQAHQPNGSFWKRIVACRSRMVLKIGTHLFVHGSIDADVIRFAQDKQRNIAEWANELVKNALDTWNPCNDFKKLASKLAWGRELCNDTLDDMRAKNPQACSTHIRTLFDALNANLNSAEPVAHIVVGHHPQLMRKKTGFTVAGPKRVASTYEEVSTRGAGAERFREVTATEPKGINCHCNGEVWRVDVAMSRGFAPFHVHPDRRSAEQRRTMEYSVRPSILLVEQANVQSDPDYTIRSRRIA